jgi:hypothetical protein
MIPASTITTATLSRDVDDCGTTGKNYRLPCSSCLSCLSYWLAPLKILSGKKLTKYRLFFWSPSRPGHCVFFLDAVVGECNTRVWKSKELNLGSEFCTAATR